jgi:hypothetical protein
VDLVRARGEVVHVHDDDALGMVEASAYGGEDLVNDGVQEKATENDGV